MNIPKIKTKVAHSQSKDAWNVIGTSLGKKYKIARVPYAVEERFPEASEKAKQEAFEHATFISYCFNHAEQIMSITTVQ